MDDGSLQEPVFQAEDLQERQALLFDVTNSQAYKAGRASCAGFGNKSPGCQHLACAGPATASELRQVPV